jgi:hypothetical protein
MNEHVHAPPLHPFFFGFCKRDSDLTRIGTCGFIGPVRPILPRVLRRLGSALSASYNLGNPLQVGWKRLFGKPSDLLTVVDRPSGLRCLCTLNSHPMFSDIWYSHVYDVAGVPIRDGDVVIDIGANQGFFTDSAAFKGSRVLAFEPVPELCQRLRENVDRKQVSFIEERPSIGNIMRLTANSALLTS